MIRVNKPALAPERLRVQGKNKRRKHSNDYTGDPAAYQSGVQKFEFDRTIFADETVKEALLTAQHKKCCFCERKIGQDGDVEHFRPKKAYRQKARQRLQYPGYYWLAYEWNNLYLSCSACNQRHKQNLFPLTNPNERATDHNHSIAQEQPLLIDPGNDDPEALIGFRGEIPFAINGNTRGKTTIESLKLDERDLPDIRLQALQKLKFFYKIVEAGAKQPNNSEMQKLLKEAKQFIEEAVLDSAEFAAAARSAIASNFQFVIDPTITPVR